MKIFVLLTIILLGLMNYSLATSSKEMTPVVDDLCSRKVVLLGEDSHHGSGKTMEVKIEIVKRLINDCHFSGVFFESPVYEFLNLENSIASRASSIEQVSQSIGGLWSNAKPMKSFASFLHQNAIEGKISLGGIDSQFGANQPFSQKTLPKKLSVYLDSPELEECEAELYRNLNWKYDETNPYNNNAQERIDLCVLKIKEKTDASNRHQKVSLDDKYMAENFYRLTQFRKGSYFNLRDKSMAENINWHLSRLPKESKVIVWMASIHAAKSLLSVSKDKISTGYYLEKKHKAQVASIGFSALSGSFGRSKAKEKSIIAAPLASQALLNNAGSLVYLNKKNLKDLGKIKSQSIRYGAVMEADWSEVFDGVIVLREEKPIENSR